MTTVIKEREHKCDKIPTNIRILSNRLRYNVEGMSCVINIDFCPFCGEGLKIYPPIYENPVTTKAYTGNSEITTKITWIENE
jgi:hypothetical protein